MARIAAIIVNHATADLAIAAVESLRTHAPDTVVHLVDNASPGDDPEKLRHAHGARGWGDHVVLRAETVNHGFGRANNLVLDALAQSPAPPDYVFLLNPDAEIGPGTIPALARFLDGHAQAAIAGPRIRTPDGQPVPAAFRFPSALGEFVAAAAFGPVARTFPERLVPLAPDHPTAPVGWVSGAACMVRLSALGICPERGQHSRVGGFDPDFFLYYEEVELMHRLGRAGWQVWHVADAEVHHVGGAATGITRTRRRPAYWYDSWHLYFRKVHGRPYAVAAGTAWLAGAVLNHALARLRGRTPAAPRHLFGDFWARAGRPLLGLRPRPLAAHDHG